MDVESSVRRSTVLMQTCLLSMHSLHCRDRKAMEILKKADGMRRAFRRSTTMQYSTQKVAGITMYHFQDRIHGRGWSRAVYLPSEKAERDVGCAV